MGVRRKKKVEEGGISLQQGQDSRRWVAIQRNPRSGSGLRRHRLLELVRELKRLGFCPRLFKTREGLQDWVAKPEIREHLACIVAAGGDGTVADVFNRHPGVRLAILPLGTENLLARFLGLPASGKAAARLIAQGRLRTLDLGQLGARRFALMASAGFDADVIQRLHHSRHGNISRLSYVQPILESVRKYTYPEIRLWVDDAAAPVTGRMAVVVNVPMYALGLSVARCALGDDGVFDLRLFHRGSAFQMVRYLCNLGLGRHERLPDVTALRGRRVRIESDVPVPIQIDGDPAGWTPAEVHVLPAALDVIVP
jgi:diacylglycerol kinase family enzyme